MGSGLAAWPGISSAARPIEGVLSRPKAKAREGRVTRPRNRADGVLTRNRGREESVEQQEGESRDSFVFGERHPSSVQRPCKCPLELILMSLNRR